MACGLRMYYNGLGQVLEEVMKVKKMFFKVFACDISDRYGGQKIWVCLPKVQN